VDEKAFTGESEEESFWLFEAEATGEVKELRKALGESQGWSDENWFQDPANLRTLYNELNSNHADLLEKLGAAADDSTKLELLREVNTAVAPGEDEKAEVEEGQEAGQVDAGASAAAKAPASAPEPVKKTSLFARKHPETDSGAGPAEQRDPDETLSSGAPVSDAGAETSTSTSAGVAAEDEKPKTGLFARRPAKEADAGEKAEDEKASAARAPAAEEPAGAADATAGQPDPASAPPETQAPEALQAELVTIGEDATNPLTEDEVKEMLADPKLEEHLQEAESSLDDELNSISDEDLDIDFGDEEEDEEVNA
jgi:hypothetical protein